MRTELQALFSIANSGRAVRCVGAGILCVAWRGMGGMNAVFVYSRDAAQETGRPRVGSRQEEKRGDAGEEAERLYKFCCPFRRVGGVVLL